MNKSIHTANEQVIIFTLDEQYYALSLLSVIKVIHSIEVKPLPETPDVITGVVNIRGRIIPVADIRKRLGLARREMDLNDQIIIADTGKREIAIPVDCVTGIREIEPKQFSATAGILPFVENISGIVKIDDGLVFIFDLNRFLSIDEEKQLEQSLKNRKDES